jgi:hypothetical protein
MGGSEAEFAARVWEHSTSGVCAVDARGSLVMINAAARRTLGGTCAALIGTRRGRSPTTPPWPSLREASRAACALRAELCTARAGDRRVLGLSVTASRPGRRDQLAGGVSR